jgi:hypothetical protein
MRRAAGPSLPGKTGWCTTLGEELGPDLLGESEVRGVVAVQVPELAAPDPEGELTAATGTGLDARPGGDLVGDLLAGGP